MKVYALGDSLTEGDYGIKGKSGIANISEYNYPFFLSKITDSIVVNYGKCGYTPISYLDYLLSSKIDFSDADIVIIMLGTNGELGNNNKGNDAYDKIIKYVLSFNKNIKIYLCTCPNATTNKSYSNCGYIDRVNNANKFIINYAKNNNYDLIRMDEHPLLTIENEYVTQPNDGLHFSTIGYYFIAAYIKEKIGL